MNVNSPYPVQLVALAGARVLIVGAGEIAARKAEELCEIGARVHVVTTVLGDKMARIRERLAQVDLREARASDVEGARLVIAATDDLEVNRTIARAARALGILVNAVDDPEECTFYASAVVRRGPITISFGSNGQAPLLAGQLRRMIEAVLPSTLDGIGQMIATARERGVKGLRRRGAMLRALADPMLERLVDRGELERATERFERLATDEEERFDGGTVAIVGAGPGSRGLLTLRALDRIHRADVIIHDALVEAEVLEEALPGTRLIMGGRRAGCGGQSPDVTVQRMIHEARLGHRVVRLHAGDPFVFGRGGEEIDALAAADVRYEVVPGISAALASASLAGVPLTARGESRGISIRTGHTAEGYVDTLNLPPEDDTLVVLMGLGAIERLMQRLIDEGRPTDTPAMAVCEASRPGQRVVIGTIADLAQRVTEAALPSPTTLIIGRVVARARAKSIGLEVAA